MRGLKKREDRVLPEGTFCWGKFTITRELFIWGMCHCRRHGKIAYRTPPIFAISCKPVSFQSRRQIGKDYRLIHGTGNLREVSLSLNLKEQIRVWPCHIHRWEEKKEAIICPGRGHCTKPKDVFCMKVRNNWCFSGRIDTCHREQQSKDYTGLARSAFIFLQPFRKHFQVAPGEGELLASQSGRRRAAAEWHPAAASLEPSLPLPTEGQKSWGKLAFTWGTRGTSLWFCWKPECQVSFIPLPGCISTPAKTTALWYHPSRLLQYRMLLLSSQPHRARTYLYHHHIPPPSLPPPTHTPTQA